MGAADKNTIYTNFTDHVVSKLLTHTEALRAEALAEAEALCRAVLFSDKGDRVLTPMEDLVKLRKTDVSVVPDEVYYFAGVYSFGRGVFRSSVKRGAEFSYSKLTRLHENDFVYPKLMAWEGAFGIVPKNCDGHVVSPEFPVFEVNQDRVLPEVLDYFFKTPSVWPEIAGVSIGTNVRRRRLHPSRFLEFKFPLPSMNTQLKLRLIDTSLTPVRKLQAAGQAELDALLPAVLDRAFKGEL